MHHGSKVEDATMEMNFNSCFRMLFHIFRSFCFNTQNGMATAAGPHCIAAGKWQWNADGNELAQHTLDEVIWRTRNVLAFHFHVNWMLRCTFCQNARSVRTIRSAGFILSSLKRSRQLSRFYDAIVCWHKLAFEHAFHIPQARVLCKWICEAIQRSSLQFGDGIDAIVIMIWIVSNVKFVLSKSMASSTSGNTENLPRCSTQQLYAHSNEHQKIKECGDHESRYTCYTWLECKIANHALWALQVYCARIHDNNDERHSHIRRGRRGREVNWVVSTAIHVFCTNVVRLMCIHHCRIERRMGKETSENNVFAFSQRPETCFR